MKPKQPLLQIQNLSSHYGPIQALNGINLEVYQGEIVTLLGANGAGKSTLLMTISGIQPLSDGRLLLDGSDISLLPADERVTRGVVQVPEGRRIFPRLSVLDNLLLGAYRSTDKTVSTKTQQLIFDLFPILFERKKQLGGTLSGGEQQMLAIGRALMANPRLLLLDEPSMGIAPLLVNKIFAALKELHSQGLTIFLVEQNAHAALTLSQRAYVLETGSVTLSDSSSSLLTDPRIKDAYLGA